MLAPVLRKSFVSLVLFGALALCALFANSIPAFAAGGQTGIVSGTVVDASNSAVSNADILITAPVGRYRAHTDGKGRFTILGVDIDTYTITVQKDGFAKMVQDGVAVLGDQTTDLGTMVLQKS